MFVRVVLDMLLKVPGGDHAQTACLEILNFVVRNNEVGRENLLSGEPGLEFVNAMNNQNQFGQQQMQTQMPPPAP